MCGGQFCAPTGFLRAVRRRIDRSSSSAAGFVRFRRGRWAIRTGPSPVGSLDSPYFLRKRMALAFANTIPGVASLVAVDWPTSVGPFASAFWARTHDLVAPQHQRLLEETKALVASVRAGSTRSKYAGYWDAYEAWCREANNCPIPVDPAHVALFRSTIALKATSYASVKLVSATIFVAHGEAGLSPNPTKSQLWKPVRKGAKRRLGAMVF